MKILWKKDFEKKYEFNIDGLSAKLHFKKEGDIVRLPDEFKDFISKQLSDPIKTGLCTIVADTYIDNDIDDDTLLDGDE